MLTGPIWAPKFIALTAAKFVFSNSGNFRAKANLPIKAHGLALNAHSGNEWGKIPVLTGIRSTKKLYKSVGHLPPGQFPRTTPPGQQNPGQVPLLFRLGLNPRTIPPPRHTYKQQLCGKPGLVLVCSDAQTVQ